MGHVHAALMRQYADDAAEHDEPWRLWQFQWNKNAEWADMTSNPSWDELTQYRRKPRTIRIGEFDVPEPMRTAPEIGTVYYSADIRGDCWPDEWQYDNDFTDIAALKGGYAHTTERAARLHAIALCSLTATPERLAELRKMAAELEDK